MQQLSLGITIDTYSSYYQKVIERIKNKQRNFKLDFANQVLVSNCDLSFLQFSKHLNTEQYNVGRNRLYKELRKHKVLMHNNLPYQYYIDREYFVTSENIIWNGYTHINVPQTFITPKGQLWLVQKLKQWGCLK